VDYEQIRDKHIAQVTVTGFGGGGGYAAFALQGSFDGDNWYGIIGFQEITTEGTFLFIDTAPARYIQPMVWANSSSGGSPETVTMGVAVAAD
jgi:hypothetical protein